MIYYRYGKECSRLFVQVICAVPSCILSPYSISSRPKFCCIVHRCMLSAAECCPSPLPHPFPNTEVLKGVGSREDHYSI